MNGSEASGELKDLGAELLGLKRQGLIFKAGTTTGNRGDANRGGRVISLWMPTHAASKERLLELELRQLVKTYGIKAIRAAVDKFG
jgi:hypothetical protein